MYGVHDIVYLFSQIVIARVMACGCKYFHDYTLVSSVSVTPEVVTTEDLK